jgi:hypothetical protein
MVSFSFTQKGQVENQIAHLKTQKLYDAFYVGVHSWSVTQVRVYI